MNPRPRTPPMVLLVQPGQGGPVRLKEALRAACGDATVNQVTTAEEALRGLQVNGGRPGLQPDLVLVDLPDATGLGLLRAMKADRALRAIPVLVLGATASPAEVTAAYDSGANAYLPRPATSEGLAGMAERVCDHWLRRAASWKTIR